MKTTLKNGAAVRLYAMTYEGLATGLQCDTNCGAVADAAVRTWMDAGWVVTYDVTDTGDAVVAEGGSRHQAVPVARAYPNFAAFRASLKRKGDAVAYNAKGRPVRVSTPKAE